MSDFAPYREFTRRLEGLASEATQGRWSEWQAACEVVLDGAAGAELTRLVPVAPRRKAGTFFTGSKMASHLASRVPDLTGKSRIVDPTLGAGDLLLAVARRSPLAATPQKTVALWHEMFAGLDREEVFVESARLRMWLLAHLRHGVRVARLPSKEDFQSLERGDLFEREDIVERATDVVLNPPFSRIQAPSFYEHGSGFVNAAAIMSSFLIDNAKPGLRIHAILPEVLRTGSLYKKWRDSMNRQCEVRRVISHGLFETADVDVFMVTLEKRRKTAVRVKSVWSQQGGTGATIGGRFKVSVGAVVEFRDPQEGPNRIYIHPKNVASWGEVTHVDERRQYSGTTVKPPFVVLRRTSRPGDRWRASASLMLGRRQVAVDNHFIVCRPEDGQIDTCRALVKALQSDAVNEFLNREMRCRHLTVDVVKRIPIDSNTITPITQ